MRYWKIECSNGFCGCDETFYIKVNSDSEGLVENIGCNIMESQYSFAEPDERFITYNEDDEESYENAVEEYLENCCFQHEEVTKEEYEENRERWAYEE